MPDRPNPGLPVKRRLRAEALNAAGEVVWFLGCGLGRLGDRLLGWSGWLDASADNAGYWEAHDAR